jgi:hypothetical protein
MRRHLPAGPANSGRRPRPRHRLFFRRCAPPSVREAERARANRRRLELSPLKGPTVCAMVTGTKSGKSGGSNKKRSKERAQRREQAPIHQAAKAFGKQHGFAWAGTPEFHTALPCPLGQFSKYDRVTSGPQPTNRRGFKNNWPSKPYCFLCTEPRLEVEVAFGFAVAIFQTGFQCDSVIC